MSEVYDKSRQEERVYTSIINVVWPRGGRFSEVNDCHMVCVHRGLYLRWVEDVFIPAILYLYYNAASEFCVTVYV